MKLFHGTNDHAWIAIEAEGHLRGPVYLSDDIGVAGYFANWHAKKHRASALILTLEVDADLFLVDEESLLDPISLTIKRLGIRDMPKYLNDLAQCEGDTWISWLAMQHDIAYQYDWEVSLRLANAVRHNGPIDLKCMLEKPIIIKKELSSLFAPEQC